ncbi:hypothetical protein C0991_003149 [Blastosporella zonata]|nr:hypothetical protein C0991_003149 [Blastosporella zonata]
MSNQGLHRTTGNAIPPPPSFSDVNFSIIGQEPPLLKRISAPIPDYHYDRLSPSPSIPVEPKFTVDPPIEPPRPFSRPTLLQALTRSQFSDVPMSDTTSMTHNLHVPSQHSVKTSPIHPQPNMPQQDSSYDPLRALQNRLIISLGKIRPPKLKDVFLAVQTANSHAINALTSANRAHILAEQSLVTAQQAVAVAQECLAKSEQVKAHTDDALAAMNELHAGSLEGHRDCEWDAKIDELRDGIHFLGEWIAERESKETAKKQETPRTSDREVVETALGALGLVPHPNQAAEKPAGTSRAISQPDPSSNRNLNLERSAEIGDNATASRFYQFKTPTGAVPMDVAEYLPPESGDEGQCSHLSNQEGLQGQHNDDRHPRAREEPSPLRFHDDEARLLAVREEETHILALHEQTLEAARLPRDNAAAASQLKSQHNNPSGTHDKVHQARSNGSIIVENAKRALQLHKEKEAALAEQLERKRAETRRLLEERKQRELSELRKKEEEKAAELERLAVAKEQELIAEQGIRRQEVMAQKQRASAKAAARINAERARERERTLAISSQYPSSTFQPPLLNDTADSVNSISKSKETNESEKPKLLFGDVQSGHATGGPLELVPTPRPPPSPLTRTVALGLRPQTHRAKSKEDGSSKTSSVSRVSPKKPAPPTPTPSNERNSVEDLHLYRHSEDAGNIVVVPRSQIQAASPEAQAANLRFVHREGNGVHWQSLFASDIKPEPQNIPSKKESPLPMPLVGSQDVASRNTANVITVPAPTIPLPVKPHPLFPLSSVQKLVAAKGDESTPDSFSGTTNSVSTPVVLNSSARAPPAAEATNPPSATTKPVDLKHLPSNIIASNPNRDKVTPKSTVGINTKFMPEATWSTSAFLGVPPNGSAAIVRSFDHVQIPPSIHSNDGWDRPAEEDGYSSRFPIDDSTPLQRPNPHRRGAHHYSPRAKPATPNPYTSDSYPPRFNSPLSRRSLSPAPRSPMLGKRRLREDFWEDEPPARRQRPLDGMRGPPPSTRETPQWRSASPMASTSKTLQARIHTGSAHDMPRPPPSRELARPLPSSEPPTLQARIGTASHQSYRPNYTSVDYTQLRNHPDSYRQGQTDYSTSYPDRYSSGQREFEPRAPWYNRGRGHTTNLNNRGNSRGRGGRGGSRFNLEQRISSSNTPLTLMHRLESPPPRNI